MIIRGNSPKVLHPRFRLSYLMICMNYLQVFRLRNCIKLITNFFLPFRLSKSELTPRPRKQRAMHRKEKSKRDRKFPTFPRLVPDFPKIEKYSDLTIKRREETLHFLFIRLLSACLKSKVFAAMMARNSRRQAGPSHIHMPPVE